MTPFPPSQTLKQHYVPRVADVATRLLSPNQLAKPEEDLGQYLDLSHSEVCVYVCVYGVCVGRGVVE